MILKPYYEIISCLDDMHEANTSLVQLHKDGFFFFCPFDQYSLCLVPNKYLWGSTTVIRKLQLKCDTHFNANAYPENRDGLPCHG